MAIITEKTEDYTYNYSDAHKYIIQEQTGIKYATAWDVPDTNFTYVESEEDLPDEPESEADSLLLD